MKGSVEVESSNISSASAASYISLVVLQALMQNTQIAINVFLRHLCTRAQRAAGPVPSQQGFDWWLSDETLQVRLEAAGMRTCSNARR